MKADTLPRPWGVSVAAGLAVGLPLMVAAYYGELALGALGAMGALVILHIPPSAPTVPVRRLVGCAAGVAVSPALGELVTAWPPLTLPLFGLLIAAIVALTRASSLPPPGHTFFILGACSGAAEGFHPTLIPYVLAAPAAGAAGAVAIGLIARTLWAGQAEPSQPTLATARPAPTARAVGIEALVFGFFAMLSLAIAQGLGLDRPYWVPISCVAVMRGISLQAVLNRNIQRVGGTLIGVVLTLFLLVSHPSPAMVIGILMLLVMSVHRTMGQNYAITVLLATPASLMLTELASLDSLPDLDLLITRVQDIALGSVIGVFGGAVLHGSRTRPAAHGVDSRG